MRSLTPKAVQVAKVAYGESARAAAVTIDPETGAVYAAIERQVEFGLDVDVVKIADLEGNDHTPDVVSSFSTPVLAPFKLPEGASQVVNMQYFADDRSLIILMAGGDIATMTFAEPLVGSTSLEVVGSIDSGIKAAAWSPDEEQLVLITGEDHVVCMTRTFDELYDEPLRTDDFGDDKFINVGWGSKTTQFHGSLGKAALMAARAPKPTEPTSFAHPTDDALPRITFRGDAKYFAVSSLDPYPSSGVRRQVRIFSRDASEGGVPRLSATSESIAGLEGPIAWRPSGNVIASLVRYGYEGGGEGRKGRWDVAMLERNGLRHGGFELREDEKTWENGVIRGMEWNADSEVLAIWVRREEQDTIQLWTMKNYHYYLKQEIYPHQAGSKRFVSMRWHPEQPMTLYVIGEDNVQVRSFAWDTYASHLPMPNDTGTVAVVDGKKLLVTPFRTQNVPPPMSSYQIALPEQAVHVAMSPTEDALGVLFASGLVQVWDLGTRLPEAGQSRLRAGGKPAEPKLRWEAQLAPEDEFIAKQIALSGDGKAAAVFWSGGEDAAVLRTADANEVGPQQGLLESAEAVGWEAHTSWFVVCRDGFITSLGDEDTSVGSLCPKAQVVQVSHEARLVFGINDEAKLYASSTADSSDGAVIASNVTSLTLTPSFVIYTTTDQRSHYAPLESVSRLVDGIPDKEEWETRRVERGALSVVACPSSMSLVLQMPRGNLETVYPRPLVLAVVRQDILAGRYREALMSCRKNRLDLNIIYDLAPEQFMASLPQFVEQVPEVDYLNLFVSSLNSDDVSGSMYADLGRDTNRPPVPKDKVNSVCDNLRALVEAKGLVDYVETILTTYVCKSPPDYEGGLSVLLRLQAKHPEVVEEAIKYIIFLSNVNQLYDVALGMYNFELVLMVAQYSQKDPKEYLPFLRELRALEKYEQRFRIDDHLGRRESALRNLKAAGPDRFDDAASYLSRYELFDEAFKLYADDKEKLTVIHGLYGDYLYDRRDFNEAAISYILAGQEAKALKAYERAHAWRELFTLAKNQPADVIAGMVERVTDYLGGRGRSIEASQVFLDYANDVDSAIDILCRGGEFSEAYRLIAQHGKDDLVEEVVHPAIEDAHEALAEVFEEMDGQLDKEMARIRDLRKVRLADPDTFFIVEHELDLDNVDVATQATTVATQFTRYTVAPTTVLSQSTRITGQTNRTRRKSSKKARGRKGTVDEWDYLIASIGRLVARTDEKSDEALTLLRHVILPFPEQAKDLQEQITKFRRKLSDSLEDVWSDRATIIDAAEESGGEAFNGGEFAKARELQRPDVKAWSGLGRLL